LSTKVSLIQEGNHGQGSPGMRSLETTNKLAESPRYQEFLRIKKRELATHLTIEYTKYRTDSPSNKCLKAALSSES